MKMRSYRYSLFLFIPLMMWVMPACEKDMFDRQAQLYEVKLQVHYPGHYSVRDAPGVSVRLISQDNGLSSEKQTNERGEVVFTHVRKGDYRLSVSKKIDAAQALELGETIVTRQDADQGRTVNLNYTRENLVIEQSTDLGAHELQSSLPGRILIGEVFYTGSTTPNGRPYYSDHFVEIFNNTDEVIFADSLCLANLYGANGNVDSNPTAFGHDQDHVYLQFVWMIPGTGTSHPIMPGKSLIIAQDGLNHQTDPNGNANSIDLSGADWETFLEREVQRDIDVMEVPNMQEIFATRPNTHDWILHSYGSSLVLFKVKKPETLDVVPVPHNDQGHKLLKLPAGNVLDAVDCLAYPHSGMYKRIPSHLDAGFVFCDGIFNKQSCRRKVQDVVNGRIILQDTNHSGEDFEVITPPQPGATPVPF